MIVVDASAIVELLLRTELGARVEDRLFGGEEALHSPHLLDVEVLQVLRKLEHRRILDAARAREAVDDLAILDLHRHSHLELMSRVWQLRDNLTAYDAVYVALTEALDATLVTCDGPLSRSVGHDARIEWIG